MLESRGARRGAGWWRPALAALVCLPLLLSVPLSAMAAGRHRRQGNGQQQGQADQRGEGGP
ncbi:hypothetical protein, partial [Chromobacterium phragmitis]|uniref:hypothetical protein n=1 Tax=Chromobacterium phragmitis TaxID=2202141 RepID=UPI0032671C29